MTMTENTKLNDRKSVWNNDKGLVGLCSHVENVGSDCAGLHKSETLTGVGAERETGFLGLALPCPEIGILGKYITI